MKYDNIPLINRVKPELQKNSHYNHLVPLTIVPTSICHNKNGLK